MVEEPEAEEVPPEIAQWLREQYREQERLRRFGHVRPMVWTDHQGYRFVAVGPSRVCYGKNWNTVPDFLHRYCRLVLGKDWYDAERAKPVQERHPILQWDAEVLTFYMRHSKGLSKGELFDATATGPVMAHVALSYDLYAIEHHGLLKPSLVNRLKDRGQFQGARYEAYVTASFIRAGFEITPENEADGTVTHCEFAAHHGTGASYSVEAKSRHRPGILGRLGAPPPMEEIVANVSGLLADALRKHAPYDRIVFVDVNVPPQEGPLLESDWFKRAAGQLSRLERQPTFPVTPAFVFFTNQPYHYVGAEADEPGRSVVFTGLHHPDFMQSEGVEIDEASLRFAEKYPAMRSLYESLLTHTQIPQRFE